MKVGDVLEIIAAVLGVGGVTLVVGELVGWPVGAGAGLLAATVFILYFAQVWADQPFSSSRSQQEPQP